jgi:hypothetical protein
MSPVLSRATSATYDAYCPISPRRLSLSSLCSLRNQIPTRAPALEKPAHPVLLYLCVDSCRRRLSAPLAMFSVFAWQQDCRGVSMAGLVGSFRDDPDFHDERCAIRRQNAGAVNDGLVIRLPVLFVQFAPITRGTDDSGKQRHSDLLLSGRRLLRGLRRLGREKSSFELWQSSAFLSLVESKNAGEAGVSRKFDFLQNRFRVFGSPIEILTMHSP